MDNPNPIYYRDLVTPDNSISDLISQLDALISKYEEAKGKIQSAAQDAAKSMSGLAGATSEQRQQISELSTQTDKLAENYTRYNNAEREIYRQKQSVIQATKEQNQIDKLLVQIKNSEIGSYNRLSAQYRLNKIRLNEMSAEMRKNTEAGRQLETETRKIYEEMKRLQEATGKYQLNVGNYTSALTALPGPLGSVTMNISRMQQQLSGISRADLPMGSKALAGFSAVAAGAVTGIIALGRGIAGAVSKIKGFEQSNVNLSTILGVNVREMQGLTESALQLGRTTEYTAQQVTNLQIELAKLGFNQGQIVNMQKYILQFATAVGADLPEAAAVAGSTLRAFGISSANTEDALATLAVATNKSALSFKRIQDSIGTVFPVANAFGISLKDTIALLGALANAGFDASSAATATRNILLNLADANGKLAQSLGGAATNFDEIINGLRELRDRGIDLSEALDLTDKRSVSAFSALLAGTESTKQLRKELENLDGALGKIQTERLDTLEGSTKILKSAWEGLMLSFRGSTGVLKSLTEGLTSVVSSINELLFPTQVFQSEQTEYFTQTVQKIYKEAGEDAARAYLERWYNTYLSENQKAAAKWTKSKNILGPLATIFAANANSVTNATYASVNAVQTVLDNFNKQAEADRADAERAKADAEAAAKAQESAKKNAEQKAAEDAAKAAKKAEVARKKAALANLQAVVDGIQLEIDATETGTQEMLNLRLQKIDAQRALELEKNAQKAKELRQDEAAINAKFDRMRQNEEKKQQSDLSKIRLQSLQAEQQALQLQIGITQDGTQEMLDLRLALIEKQREIELEQNRQKAEKMRIDEKLINAKYDALALRQTADFRTKQAQRDLKASQDLAANEFALLDRNERQKTIFRLQQEEARLRAVLKMNETAAEKMTETEVAAVNAAIDGIKKQRATLGYSNLYEVLGLNMSSQQQSALNTALSSVQQSLSSLVSSWQAVADAAAEAARSQVEAAKEALDAEIQARNEGYANNVKQAQKEYELSKKNLANAQKEQERAQKAQIALDTVTQASSLITATANIWAAFSKAGMAGPALAAAATAVMWGSFLAAKIKAVQVAGVKKEEYGEGTVELLQGGSHASGHDIDLGTKKDGTKRRAEGGEYFAVINKRNSRKFGSVIPDVINAFNDGTFADKYQKAGAAMDAAALNIIGGASGTDVSRLEQDVAAIRKQGDETRFVDADGCTVIQYRNLTRKIRS